MPLLSISDVFLLPSAQESFGLAALEAMACEVPVVASRVGGLPEVIEHGETGFLHARVSRAARRRVREHFCVDRVVPMYEACYRSVMT